MSITVKFFATLREDLGLDVLKIEASEAADVTAVWAAATKGAPMPDHALCSLNLEHVPLDASVKDGDEVAFFPPVTGG